MLSFAWLKIIKFLSRTRVDRLFHHRPAVRPARTRPRNDLGRKCPAHHRILRRFHHLLVVRRRHVGTWQQRRLEHICILPRSERNLRRPSCLGRTGTNSLNLRGRLIINVKFPVAYLLAIQQKRRQGGGNFKNPLIQKIMLIQKLPFHSKITGAFCASFQSHSSYVCIRKAELTMRG